MQIRAIAFIDGFNFYHSVRALGENRLKWCDLRALISLFLHPGDELTAVRFYTADPRHCAPDVRHRWRLYCDALAATGVDIVTSPFKRKDRTVTIAAAHPAPLRRLQIRYRAHEEKETDVRIALDMINLAHRGEFEKCFLVSGDSDLLPAIKMMLKEFPDNRMVLLAPPFQRVQEARAIAKQTPKSRFVVRDIDGRRHIAGSRLPDEITGNGARILSPYR